MKLRIFALLLALLCVYSSAFAAELVLPAELKTIKAQAFYGDTGLDEVIVPYGVHTIESQAFADSSLRAIYLPESVKAIADDAFSGCDAPVVSCISGGSIQEWCRKNNITCAVRQPETLKMATSVDYPPYEYYNEYGEAAGIDVDIAMYICNALGYNLEILDMDYDAMLIYMKAGKADFCIAAITPDDENRQYADFTDVYLTDIQSMLVAPDSSIAGPEDLFEVGKTYKIAAIQETIAASCVAADVESRGNATLLTFTDGESAVQALSAGKVDCVVMDSVSAAWYADERNKVCLLSESYCESEFAIAVPGGSALKAQFNAVLAQMQAEGVIRTIVENHSVF